MVRSVDQHRHLNTRVRCLERAAATTGTEVLRDFDGKGDVLFAQRDLNLLRVGRQRMLKQQHVDLSPSSHSMQARVPEPIANGWKPDWPENQPLQDTSRIDV